MSEITTKHSLSTDFPACSLEWNRECHEIFSVGLYELDKKDENVSANNVRKGKVELFNYESRTDELVKLQSVETDAILDQKWRQSQLLTATSTGLTSFTFDPNSKQLTKLSEVKLNDVEQDCLALSLDVKEKSENILVSDSKGKIALINLETNSISSQWKAHDFEAWTVAFGYDDNTIFSGGDDSKMKVWDIRESQSNAIKTLHRDAGVTSLLAFDETTLLVGSYDEKLCSYDLRRLKSPQAEINLKGGVWRIKPSPVDAKLFLVACMYQNFSIVQLTVEDFNLINEYNEHESICYGCDWQPATSTTYNSCCSLIFACCSFYDRKLSVCEIKGI